MRWSDFLTEAFNKPNFRNIRLATSLLFIGMTTIIIMTIFQVAKVFLDSDMTLWESHIYTIIFTGLVAPAVALFILLKFEGLYAKISEENEERQRAEESRKESEERFRILSETSAAAIFVFHDGNFVYVNPAAETITGYTRDELYSMKFWELMHPDQRELIRERGLARQRGERAPSRYETRILTRDGREKWLDVSASLINYDGRPAGLVTTVDVTERKQAEDAVRKSDVRFRSLIQNSSDIIRILDNEGRIIFDSPSSEKILGYPPDYMLGKFPFDFIHPDDLKLVRKELGTVYDKRNSGIPIEFRIRKADGEYLWVESIGVNMTGVPGIDGIVITTRPIGERKRAEEELKAAKQQAELYLDLMGHDINNLHQIALGYLELARDMPAGEEQTIFMDKPVEVLQRSAQLIQNVRKLQKLHDGLFKTELIDVFKVLSDVQQEFGAVPHKPVTLNFNGCERCCVRTNELLHDVFANLVSNAIKHTGDRAEIVIDLDVVNCNGGRYYRVLVEDNGPGIPDDFKAKIFDRMLKGTNNAKGMGLGLYLVKSLVDSYGGQVWVEDRVFGDHTKGAKFVVMLPAIEK